MKITASDQGHIQHVVNEAVTRFMSNEELVTQEIAELTMNIEVIEDADDRRRYLTITVGARYAKPETKQPTLTTGVATATRTTRE